MNAAGKLGTEVISNSSNEIIQTWCTHFSQSLYSRARLSAVCWKGLKCRGQWQVLIKRICGNSFVHFLLTHRVDFCELHCPSCSASSPTLHPPRISKLSRERRQSGRATASVAPSCLRRRTVPMRRTAHERPSPLSAIIV